MKSKPRDNLLEQFGVSYISYGIHIDHVTCTADTLMSQIIRECTGHNGRERVK